MTFEKLKEVIDALTPAQLAQTVCAYLGNDCFEDLMIVSNTEGALVFIPELELNAGGEDAVESS